MKLGVCTGISQWDMAAEAGFDYIECPLNGLAAMTEEEYRTVLESAGHRAIPLYACNCLLPATIKVTGPSTEEGEQRRYLDLAFSRARAMGASMLVFGSGGSRRVPEGYPFGEAWRQIASFLAIAGEYCDRYSLEVAIEPLRRQESNILNYVSEAVALAAFVNHPRIRVLGDTFHMICGGEPWEALSQAGPLLEHMHISHALPGLTGRDYPSPGDGGDYEALFQTLKGMGYQGNVSIEASTEDFLRDGRKAVEALRREMGE